MGIEDLDLKKFKEYTRKERTCNEVCSKFGISILEFSYLVNMYNTNENILFSAGTDGSLI